MRIKTRLNTLHILEYKTIDDVADGPAFIQQAQMLHSLYAQGTHKLISARWATQPFNAIHPIIKRNATKPYIHRLKSNQDLETCIDEVTAALDKETLLKLYSIPTRKPDRALEN